MAALTLSEKMLILTVGISMLGCVKYSDENQAEAETQAGLQAWVDTLVVLLESGHKMNEYTIDGKGPGRDMLLKWQAGNLISSVQLMRMEKDYWGREYFWEYLPSNNTEVLRIGSAGRNGVWEAGAGDDLYVELEKTGPGGVRWKLKPMRK